MRYDRIIQKYICFSRDEDDIYNVYHWIECGSESVREGLHHNQFIDSGTLKELRFKYPKAKYPVMSKLPVDPMPMMPPAGFDPADCGERWDDDY